MRTLYNQLLLQNQEVTIRKGERIKAHIAQVLAEPKCRQFGPMVRRDGHLIAQGLTEFVRAELTEFLRAEHIEDAYVTKTPPTYSHAVSTPWLLDTERFNITMVEIDLDEKGRPKGGLSVRWSEPFRWYFAGQLDHDGHLRML